MSCNGPKNIHPHVSNHKDFTALQLRVNLKQQNHYVYNFDKKKMNYSSIDCTHMENGPATAKDEVN
jgi:hypothetical protein